MKSDDPLEVWLIGEGREEDWLYKEHSSEISLRLDELEGLLDNPPPPPRKPDFYKSGIAAYPYMPPIPLSPDDLPRAQGLYRRVAASKGSGKNSTQEGLLHLIGSNADPSALPFWLDMLELAPPRDQFGAKRKTYALAALALIAIKHDLSAAYDTLLSLTKHRDPAVRAQAVLYLGHAYLEAERPLPVHIRAYIYDVAITDPSFLPRYEARHVLRHADLAVPSDNPDGAFIFKVSPVWLKGVHRKIEVRSNQTLEDLHLAIQRAFKWGDDHLYSFYMNGVVHDARYEIPHPALVERDVEFPFFALPIELAGDSEEADERVKEILAGFGVSLGPGEDKGVSGNVEWDGKGALTSINAVIGELGLVTGHSFLYLFDFGEDHVFTVTVDGVKEKAGRGTYPRVVERQGESPPQYWYEEDEEP